MVVLGMGRDSKVIPRVRVGGGMTAAGEGWMARYARGQTDRQSWLGVGVSDDRIA